MESSLPEQVRELIRRNRPAEAEPLRLVAVVLLKKRHVSTDSTPSATTRRLRLLPIRMIAIAMAAPSGDPFICCRND